MSFFLSKASLETESSSPLHHRNSSLPLTALQNLLTRPSLPADLTCNRRWHLYFPSSGSWHIVGTARNGFSSKLLLQHAPVACLIASRIRLSLYHFRYSARSVDNDIHFYSFQLLSNFQLRRRRGESFRLF